MIKKLFDEWFDCFHVFCKKFQIFQEFAVNFRGFP